MSSPLSIVILSAGQGKRMKSDLPKVLQPLAGRPLLAHVIDTARSLRADAIHVVYGHGGETVQQALSREPVSWDKEDLEVEISSKAVRIQGRGVAPSSGANSTYRLAEIQYGRFERILFLSSPINPDKVTAASKDGFLEIRLVKRPVDQACKVPISTE